MAIGDTKDKTPRSDKFSEDYKQEIFIIWYNNGKPAAKVLQKIIDKGDPLVGKKPSEYTLRNWIRAEFASKAMMIDDEVGTRLQEQLVADKIQMLYHHAKIGQELVDLGINYLRENEIKNERVALQAVVEGLKIEKESRGTPKALARLAQLSNEQLLEELDSLVDETRMIDVAEDTMHGDTVDGLSNM